MAIQAITNELTDLVNLRAAEVAGYLTVGAKPYFADQLVGKRNGQEYTFVIKDNGKYVRGKNLTGKGASNIVERDVKKKVMVGNVLIDSDFVDAVTDVKWDVEIAQPNGKELIEGLTQDVINDDLGRANTAFVGEGFSPLTKANSFLTSISTEKKFGFVDPMIESIVASWGSSFKPVEGVAPIDAKGELTRVGSTDYRFQQFLPSFEITEDLAKELASATVSSYTAEQTIAASSINGNAEDTDTAKVDLITLSGVSDDIPVGTPLFIADVMATNFNGNKTSSPKAFIVVAQKQAGQVYVRSVDFDGQGTKEAIFKDGTTVTAAGLAGKKLVNPISEGLYYTGLVRLDGSMEFDTLKKQDWSNADLTSSGLEGITVHCARAVDVVAGTNKTRWCVAALAGIVEPRAVSYVCIKDSKPNLVTL
jgi:hypothetical protein